jgi:uncharacterized coiled-coil protein SlyX
MEEYPETTESVRSEVPASIERKRWLIDFILVLAVAMLAFGYGYQQQLKVRHLAAQESVANETINDLQRELNTMADKMNNMASEQQASADAASQSARKKTALVDKRYQQLESRLTAQQRRLKETQDLVAKNRSELQSNLNSTRDELNGSIARTHEELVALAKRGERSYFEFELEKSKEFQRFGPVPLSLRKTDTKHHSFDMALIVDDNQLMKKKVNLYEPIWVHTENESQPVQVVVNRITKNVVHGYVSAPKYKPSELAAAVGPSSVNPVAPPQNTGGEPTKPEQPKR